MGIREFAHMVMADDLMRMDLIGGQLYNFHPGSHVGAGVEAGTRLIVDLLNTILKPETKTTVLLETMSGSGTEIGSTFEELKTIITRSASILGVEIDDGGAEEIASRSRGTPRIANRLLKRVRDFAQIKYNSIITKDIASESLLKMEIDEKGLDVIDKIAAVPTGAAKRDLPNTPVVIESITVVDVPAETAAN